MPTPTPTPTPSGEPSDGGEMLRPPSNPASYASSAGYGAVTLGGSCGRAFQYWEPLHAAARSAGADPTILGALLTVEGSGERAISPAGAMGLMQLMPDKFRVGDDPFDVETNLLRAAQHVTLLQRIYQTPDRVAAAYFGAIDQRGNITSASDGNVDGFEYIRRFEAARTCVGAARVMPGSAAGALVSPLGNPITPVHISFGFLDDYGLALAAYIRGSQGVQRYGTRHLAWDLVVPGAPANGRGYPIFAPMDGRIIRTSDPVGGAFGIWLENSSLNLRARLMHMDGLAPGIATGAQVRAGQWIGVLGGQGTEEFPHLHLSLELLSSGDRLDPARFYFRRVADASPVAAFDTPLSASRIDGPDQPHTVDVSTFIRLPGSGAVGAPRVSDGTLVWLSDAAGGRTVTGFDLDWGIGFRISSADAAVLGNLQISGDRVVWLDARHAADQRLPDGAGRSDVYSFDLSTSEERRLTAASRQYSQLAVSASHVAWTRQDGAESVLELHDLQTGSLTEVNRSALQVADLTISGSILAWTEHPSQMAAHEGGALHAYDVATRRRVLAQPGPASGPSIVGSIIFWEERIGVGPERLIRGRDIVTDRDHTLGLAPVPRRGLRGADGMLLWQEQAADGRTVLELHGVSSGERAHLTVGSPGDQLEATIGSGTVAWREPSGDILVAHLVDWDLSNGRFYGEQDGGGRGPLAGRLGSGVTNDDGIPLWDEFRRLGGVPVLGRPLSDRVILDDGLVYQVTEHAVLQWRPDLGTAVLADALGMLEQRGHRDRLHAEWQIPRGVQLDGADGGELTGTLRERWLTDPLILRHLLTNPDPARWPRWGLDEALGLYGQPMSSPEDFGTFVAQRFERAVLQRWRSADPTLPRMDEVTAVRIGAIFRQAVLKEPNGDSPFARSDDSAAGGR